jgi:hypothetical protein
MKPKMKGDEDSYTRIREFMYCHDQAHRYTFEAKKLKTFVESWCKGRVLNLFAGRTRLDVNEFRVDLDPEMKPDHLGEALDFLKNHCKERFDTVILDPPFNLRKSMEKYNGRYFSSWRVVQDALIPHLKEDCRVLSFGFNTGGMSFKRGFVKVAMAVVCHRGSQNDTLCIVEERYPTLGRFTEL